MPVATVLASIDRSCVGSCDRSIVWPSVKVSIAWPVSVLTNENPVITEGVLVAESMTLKLTDSEMPGNPLALVDGKGVAVIAWEPMEGVQGANAKGQVFSTAAFAL